jgi:hypothetical protein
MYRIGYKENLLGNGWYCLEKKTWLGWKSILIGSKRSILDASQQLKLKGKIVINVNINI